MRQPYSPSTPGTGWEHSQCGAITAARRAGEDMGLCQGQRGSRARAERAERAVRAERAEGAEGAERAERAVWAVWADSCPLTVKLLGTGVAGKEGTAWMAVVWLCMCVCVCV